MSWRPRLVALDVDGTLVDHNGLLPRAVKESVARIVAARVPVVIATGRGWHGTLPIVDALGLPPGPHVSSNGAVRVTYPPFRLVSEVTFDPTDVIVAARELAPSALIAVEEVGVGYRISGAFPDGELGGELVEETWEELCARPVTRVIVRDPSRDDNPFAGLAERLGMHPVSYFIGWSSWLDIAPEGINKASALAEICGEMGVSEADVLALGDGRNDIEMLAWAGRGVAIGDAPLEVQDVADDVTGRFDDGGTAAELDRWFGPTE